MSWICAQCGNYSDSVYTSDGKNFCSRSCQNAYYEQLHAAEAPARANENAARISAQAQKEAAAIAANAQKELSDKEHFRPFIEARAGRPLRMDEIVYNERAKTWGLQEEIQAEQSAMLAELAEPSGFDERVILQIPSRYLSFKIDMDRDLFDFDNPVMKWVATLQWLGFGKHVAITCTSYYLALYAALYRHLGNKWPRDFSDYSINRNGSIRNRRIFFNVVFDCFKVQARFFGQFLLFHSAKIKGFPQIIPKTHILDTSQI